MPSFDMDFSTKETVRRAEFIDYSMDRKIRFNPETGKPL